LISESLVEVRDWGLGTGNKGVLSFVQKSNMSPIDVDFISQNLAAPILENVNAIVIVSKKYLVQR
jgi:hypothetical protein